MILSMADQTRFFLWTILLGAAAGLFYDFFRIIRKIIRHPNFLTQLEDLIYWLFVSVMIFYFILHRNSGEVRIYAIIGVFSGMCLYFVSLSRLFIKASIFIIDILKKIIIAMVNILLMPVRLLYRLLSYPGRAIKKWSVKQIKHGKSISRRLSALMRIRLINIKKEIYIIRRKI